MTRPHHAPHHATLKSIERFVGTPLDDSPEDDLTRDAEAAALALFTTTAETVPAYQAFLRANGVDPAAVRTMADFRRVPMMTRESYVGRYPLAERCRRGDLSACDMVAVSSGSTGEPTFWPRALADEFSIASRFEQIFADAFGAADKKTLAVVCFPLGTWVGGMFTASSCRHLASKGYPITTVTPGNHRAEIFRAVRALSPMFEQTVLLGYPPFLKDVVDAGLVEGVPWERFGIKLVLAGEVFSEAWRTLMAERLGMTRVLLDSASLYGTADGGVLGNETPVSIAIRRFLADRPDAASALFGKTRLPTLVQYDPRSRYFEEHDGTLAFSGANGVPLVRYHIADDGGIVPYTRMIEHVRALGFDAELEARRAGAPAARALPFVYVFGRSRFALSYYGANVFPETVSLGLEQPEVRAHVTGKFVMEVQEDADRNRRLAIAVELAPGASATDALRDTVQGVVLARLLRNSSEFANYVPSSRRCPVVTLWPAGHPDHFPAGIKHRYSR